MADGIPATDMNREAGEVSGFGRGPRSYQTERPEAFTNTFLQCQLEVTFSFFLFFLEFYLFLAALGLRCGVRASHCGGFSCCGVRASVLVAYELSSCGPRA